MLLSCLSLRDQVNFETFWVIDWFHPGDEIKCRQTYHLSSKVSWLISWRLERERSASWLLLLLRRPNTLVELVLGCFLGLLWVKSFPSREEFKFLENEGLKCLPLYYCNCCLQDMLSRLILLCWLDIGKLKAAVTVAEIVGRLDPLLFWRSSRCFDRWGTSDEASLARMIVMIFFVSII